MPDALLLLQQIRSSVNTIHTKILTAILLYQIRYFHVLTYCLLSLMTLKTFEIARFRNMFFECINIDNQVPKKAHQFVNLVIKPLELDWRLMQTPTNQLKSM